jgi:hypothetical protein
MDRTAVAGTLMWVAVAMIAGFIILGTVTERLSRGGIPPMSVAACGMFLFMVQLRLVTEYVIFGNMSNGYLCIAQCPECPSCYACQYGLQLPE